MLNCDDRKQAKKVQTFYVPFHIHCKDKYRTSKQIFPEKELRGLDPNFHLHAFVRDLYIPVCLFCRRKICGLILEIYKSLTETWMEKLGKSVHTELICKFWATLHTQSYAAPYAAEIFRRFSPFININLTGRNYMYIEMDGRRAD